MKLQKEDLISKFESINGYLRYENKSKIDKTFYNDLCDEVDEFVEEMRNNECEFEN